MSQQSSMRNCTRGTVLAARLAAFVCLVFVISLQGAAAQTCNRTDFEQVVDKAAAALAQLNAKRSPDFKSKLRKLKAKRGWSHAEFIKHGTPFVRDARISKFDSEIAEFLTKISQEGEKGAAAKTPDCSLLVGLKTTMDALVDAQTKKWDYMFQKLDKALAQ